MFVFHTLNTNFMHSFICIPVARDLLSMRNYKTRKKRMRKCPKLKSPRNVTFIRKRTGATQFTNIFFNFWENMRDFNFLKNIFLNSEKK